jgi:ribosomal protein S18 acetylase RimI-like enzyme
MIIKTPTSNDIEKLASIHRASRIEYERDVIYDDDLNRDDINHFIKNWQTWMNDDDIFKLCLEDDGEVRGFILYGRTKTRPSFDQGVVPRYGAEIYAIFVDPNHFRKGYGTQLFNAACKDLTDKKLNSMILWTLKKNKKSSAFYNSFGGDKIAKQRVDMGEKSWAEESCFGWRDIRKTVL